MRVNVYSQEFTPEVKKISKISNTGKVYYGVQFILHSSENLHHNENDDDRSAVTFWLPEKSIRLVDTANTFQQAAAIIAGVNAGNRS